MSCIALDEFEALIARELPLCALFGIHAREIGDGTARLVMECRDDLLRPGGTVAGPALMALADVALYAAVLGAIGHVALAVTTNLSVNFLRKPPPAQVLAEARLLKLGKRLAVGEVWLTSAAAEGMVAHVTGTYSIPPR